ncbi:MAG: hypothetical protein OWQ59_07540 [Alicyclobacillaceae bacterium]|nr:hypothetical protein [Alicyclobacillaceae bacterium]
MRRWSVPEIRPSKGAIYVMAIAVGTFTYFFVRPRPDDSDGREKDQVSPAATERVSRHP